MDINQVEKCQEIIRDNMVVYKNVLQCILAITVNTTIANVDKVISIRELCRITLK
ncbi:hypothetical protein M0R04_04570 [Candidatus Dojkabacteria bacterium]|jgi:hypothetical protein|nr:hypothetical protein [Candidatus Dojkabacteria bacterium]